MARRSKGSGFKMRSGKSTSFKMMGAQAQPLQDEQQQQAQPVQPAPQPQPAPQQPAPQQPAPPTATQPVDPNLKTGAPKKASPAKVLGAFVDGERVTFDEALAAEAEGGNVTYTNKEAKKRAQEEIKRLQKEGDVKDNKAKVKHLRKNIIEGGGKRKLNEEEMRAKRLDEKAQAFLEEGEKRKKNDPRMIRGAYDPVTGLKGSEGRRKSRRDLLDKNKTIRTFEDSEGSQLVSGAELTWDTEGAKRGNVGTWDHGTKSKEDYAGTSDWARAQRRRKRLNLSDEETKAAKEGIQEARLRREERNPYGTGW